MFGNFNRWLQGGHKKPVIPAGHRVYAIGDVHGCKKQMMQLLTSIDEHRQDFGGSSHLVFLGDLVDRGPDSAGVLDHLRGEKLPADEVTFLLGNHEEIMLDCYRGRVDRYSPWLRFGGLQTLASYGVTREQIFSAPSELNVLMKQAVPADHISFLETFQDYWKIGDYLFVHAGIRPGTKLEDQTPSDLRWITREFLNDDRDHGFTVVHGHTIGTEIVRRNNRIGIDTGCYKTGVLSALVLEDEGVSFIDTRTPPSNEDRIGSL